MATEHRPGFVRCEDDLYGGVVLECDGFVNGASGGIHSDCEFGFEVESIESHEGGVSACIEGIGNVPGGSAIKCGPECSGGNFHSEVVAGADQVISVGSQKRLDAGRSHEDFQRAVIHLLLKGKRTTESGEVVDPQFEGAAESVHSVRSDKSQWNTAAVRIGDAGVERPSQLIDFKGGGAGQIKIRQARYGDNSGVGAGGETSGGARRLFNQQGG